MPTRVDWRWAKVPLSAILSRYGILGSLKRAGRQLKGKCPIHQGTNPRQFVVDLDKHVWRCFSPKCDKGGGILEFVAAMERVEIPEAARLITEWFAIPHGPQPNLQPIKRRKPVSGKPSHKVYVVEDRDEDPAGGEDDNKAWWTRVGSAWGHKDGKGYNVVLSALPIGGRLVLREYTEQDAAEEEKKATAKRRK